MDRFLKPNSAFERLRAEYKKYGSLIVATDFDDTLYDFHKEGHSYELVRQLVRDLYDINCEIVIWTGNQDIDFVKTFLAENDIPYHLINEDTEASVKFSGGVHKLPRKLYANVYIDDRAGLEYVYNDLTRLVKEVKDEL